MYKQTKIFEPVKIYLPFDLYVTNTQLKSMQTKLGTVNEESYESLSSMTLLEDNLLYFSIRLIALSHSRKVELICSEFCNWFANLGNTSNAPKIVNGFRKYSDSWNEMEKELEKYQKADYLFIFLNQLRHRSRSLIIIELQQLKFLCFDPLFKNRDSLTSKFFEEFWTECCLKMCWKIRNSSKLLSTEFRKKI